VFIDRKQERRRSFLFIIVIIIIDPTIYHLPGEPGALAGLLTLRKIGTAESATTMPLLRASLASLATLTCTNLRIIDL